MIDVWRICPGDADRPVHMEGWDEGARESCVDVCGVLSESVQWMFRVREELRLVRRCLRN